MNFGEFININESAKSNVGLTKFLDNLFKTNKKLAIDFYLEKYDDYIDELAGITYKHEDSYTDTDYGQLVYAVYKFTRGNESVLYAFIGNADNEKGYDHSREVKVKWSNFAHTNYGIEPL